MKVTKTNKLQISFFFKDGNFKCFEFTNKLYETLKDVFQGTPQTLPTPEDAPLELPRCIWHSHNTTLTYNLIKLDIIINIPTNYKWKDLILEYSEKLNTVIAETVIPINRIGIVTENTLNTSIHDELNEKIQIQQFQAAKELNISWLENDTEQFKFNIWTNISVNKETSNSIVVFDINSVVEEQTSDIDPLLVLEKASNIMERKMENVF